MAVLPFGRLNSLHPRNSPRTQSALRVKSGDLPLRLQAQELSAVSLATTKRAGVGKPARDPIPAWLKHAQTGLQNPDADPSDIPPASTAEEQPPPRDASQSPESALSSPGSSDPGSLVDAREPARKLASPTRDAGVATVRFGKITVHHVEIAPGQRLQPIRRTRSRSGLTYLNGPGDKERPKVKIEFPPGKEGKLRIHRERQAAMERYWLRTEQEEAEWRAEAARVAEEETARYRDEPPGSPSLVEDGVEGEANLSDQRTDKEFSSSV